MVAFSSYSFGFLIHVIAAHFWGYPSSLKKVVCQLENAGMLTRTADRLQSRLLGQWWTYQHFKIGKINSFGFFWQCSDYFLVACYLECCDKLTQSNHLTKQHCGDLLTAMIHFLAMIGQISPKYVFCMLLLLFLALLKIKKCWFACY